MSNLEISHLSHEQLLKEVENRGPWQVVDQEFELAAADGTKTLRVRKTITAAGSVRFVSENSVETGGAAEGFDDTTVSARLAVEAIKAAPVLAQELRDAKELLNSVSKSLPQHERQRVAVFINTPGYADKYDHARGQM